MTRRPTVYVVILNWNGHRDTIACLESVFCSEAVAVKAVVCDNASTDGSLEYIQRWARGEVEADLPGDARLERLVGETVRPLGTQCLTRAEAAASVRSEAVLTLIDNEANLGFAAGNNTGIAYALGQPDMDFVWLLNNDTLVEPGCLAAMVDRLASEASAAVCGSMIHFFDSPDVIQAIGGNRFNTRTGCAAMSEGRFTHESGDIDVAAIEASLDYLSGCSMLLPRNFLESVGLMNEDYFLYYEEIDWFTRASGRFKVCIAAEAVVYHREGAAIGSKSLRAAASTLSDFHMYRSRLTFMRTYYRQHMATCYLSCLADVTKRVIRGQFRNAWVVLGVLLGKQEFAG